MTIEPAPPPTERVKPQRLLLSFLGTFVLGRRDDHIPTRVFLDLLGDLDVQEPATRATLSRMVAKGLLDRAQDGRVAAYSLTPRSRRLLAEAGQRVRSDKPFTHRDDEWTLLSYSMPESRRDVRHQLRSRLVWAGFGNLRDGLWIAPGTIDIATVVGGRDGDAVVADLDAFAARPLPGTKVDALVRRAWDLEVLHAEHDRFLTRWDRPDALDGDPMTLLVLLFSDWLRLLRADPGLPTPYLPADWPSARSAATHRRVWQALEPPAFQILDERLTAAAQRR